MLTLDLTAEDAAKAERFTESRRAAGLDEALARDHMTFLRQVALADEGTARLWWLHCNLAGNDPATSWDVFREVVRPLIRIGIQRRARKGILSRPDGSAATMVRTPGYTGIRQREYHRGYHGPAGLFAPLTWPAQHPAG